MCTVHSFLWTNNHGSLCWLYFRLTGFNLQCVPKCSPGILSVRPSPTHLDDLFIPFPLLSNLRYLLLHPHSEICLSLKTEALWEELPQTSSLTSPTHWPLCPRSLPSFPWLRMKTSCAYPRPILPHLHCIPSPLSYSVASLQKKLSSFLTPHLTSSSLLDYSIKVSPESIMYSLLETNKNPFIPPSV